MEEIVNEELVVETTELVEDIGEATIRDEVEATEEVVSE